MGDLFKNLSHIFSMEPNIVFAEGTNMNQGRSIRKKTSLVTLYFRVVNFKLCTQTTDFGSSSLYIEENATEPLSKPTILFD